MRARDYAKPGEAYAPWSHSDMVKSALVEGIVIDPSHYKTKSRKRETDFYLQLLKHYTIENIHKRLDKAHDILRYGSLSPKQKGYIRILTEILEYQEVWKKFDYLHLKNAGVIIPFSGNLAELVNLIYHMPENKVITIEDFPIDAGKDYIKHVPLYNRLLLNGKDVIKHFAEFRSIELPENYLKKGRLTNEVKAILEKNNFSFNTAFEHAIYSMQKNSYRFISMFAIRNSDGNEVRIYPYELIAGTEIFFEISSSSHKDRKMTMRHGKIDGEFKYHGCNIFNVPKRYPFTSKDKPIEGRSATHDEVEIHYLPHIERPREMILEWMETRTTCNCDSALNLRNFEERRGRTVRVINHFDAHARAVLLYIAEKEGITQKNDEYGLILYPTEGLVRMTDRLRYNLSDGKNSIGVRDISYLFNETLKLEAPFSSKFTLKKPHIEDILRPKLLVRQRKRLKKINYSSSGL